MEGVHQHEFLGSWSGPSAGGNLAHPTWRDNEQFLLRVSHTSIISLALHQHCQETAADGKRVVPMGFYVVSPPLLPGARFRRLVTKLTRKDLKIVSQFIASETVTVEVELSPLPGGLPYVLIPATKIPGQEASFTLKARSSTPFEMGSLSKDLQWNLQKISGVFNEHTSGGCRHLSTWRKNPQFHLWVKENASCVVVMHQEAPEDDDDDDLNTIGFYLAKTTQMMRQKLTLWKEDLICKSKFEMKRTVEHHLDLKASETPYILIASTYDVGEYGNFTIRVYSDAGVSLEPIAGDPDWTQQSLEGKWTETTAGGSRNHNTWRHNDQYQIHITEPTTIIPVLTQTDIDCSYLPCLGYYILRADHSSRRLLQVKPKNLFHTSRFENSYEITTKKELQPLPEGLPYLIVPCTSENGEMTNFKLTVHADKPFKLQKVEQDCDWTRLAFKDRVDGAHAGGAPHQPRWRSNKQLRLKVHHDTKLRMFLHQAYDENLPGTLAQIGIVVGKPTEPGAAGEDRTEDQLHRHLVRLDKSNTCATSNFSSDFEVSLEVSLEASSLPYMIMPCSLNPDDPFTYQLEIYHPPEHRVEPVCSAEPNVTQDWHVAVMQGVWTQETAGGCRHHPTWQNNKQYRLSLPSNEPTKALITLSQALPETGRYNHLLSIGMYLCHTQRDARHPYAKGRPVVLMPSSAIVTKSNYANQQEVVLEVELDPAMTPYTLLPTTYDPDELGEFTVGIYSEKPLALEEFAQEDLWKRTTFQGAWCGKNAGGSTSCATWRNNQQYLVQMEAKCDFVCILCAIPKLHDNVFESQIGFYVVDVDNGSRRWLGPSQKNTDLIKTAPFVTTWQVQTELENVPRNFILIPATQDAGVEYSYTIDIFSDTECTVQPITKETDWHESRIEGTWEGSFVDSRSDSFSQNPRMLLVVDTPSEGYLLLQTPQQPPQSQGLVVTDKDGKIVAKMEASQAIVLPLTLESSGSPYTVVLFKQDAVSMLSKFELTLFTETPAQFRQSVD
eukprot:TRINITY_DN1666_c0_g2_i2.p1 TRINITY_DN1666_c0_g2~~TRINITY_DN1666_c0_g2_i2.p1  ORF type:complete len:1006 (+),score=189.91 TRINITY_DN1666_c0_g2_i2:184-3201(+)